LIISPIDGVPVEIQEGELAGRGGTFIPIEERLVLCDEETVGCGFGSESRISILTEMRSAVVERLLTPRDLVNGDLQCRRAL
jgi:hypothetical protein